MSIRSKPPSEEYKKNWESVFNPKTQCYEAQFGLTQVKKEGAYYMETECGLREMNSAEIEDFIKNPPKETHTYVERRVPLEHEKAIHNLIDKYLARHGEVDK